MILISLIILFLLIIVALLPPSDKNQRKIIYLFYGIVLILFAGLRPIGSDFDSKSYIDMFEFSSLSNYAVESSFNIIVFFTRDVLGFKITSLFLIYAILGVSIKLTAIKRLSEFWFLSLLIYFSYFFLAHEFTQIRAGVSTGLFMLSIPSLANKKFMPYFIYFLLAIFFHYSALIMIPIWFVARIKNKMFLLSVIPIAYLLYFMKFKMTLFIPIESIQVKINGYETLANSGLDQTFVAVNVFKPFVIMKVVLYYFFYYFYSKIAKQNSYFNTLLNLYGLSICVYILFYFMPAIATRVSEFLGVVEIVLIPMITYVLSPKLVSRLIVILVSLVFFLTLIFKNSYIQ